MKKILTWIFALLITQIAFCQGYNQERISFSNFLRRMVQAESFEGVKLVDDYHNQYIVSVVWLDPTSFNSFREMNRVAQVKAQSQASRYFNGTIIESDFVVLTFEEKEGDEKRSYIKTIEHIKENSIGFSRGLEVFSQFEKDGLVVFVFGKVIEN